MKHPILQRILSRFRKANNSLTSGNLWNWVASLSIYTAKRIWQVRTWERLLREVPLQRRPMEQTEKEKQSINLTSRSPRRDRDQWNCLEMTIYWSACKLYSMLKTFSFHRPCGIWLSLSVMPTSLKNRYNWLICQVRHWCYPYFGLLWVSYLEWIVMCSYFPRNNVVSMVQPEKDKGSKL